MPSEHEDRYDNDPTPSLPHETTEALRAEVAQREDAGQHAVETETKTHEPARLSVHIDHDLLSTLTVEVQVPEGGAGGYDATELAQKAEAKRAQLESLLDKIRRLPEVLDFDPGITLIVGENGGGKSTLAKAFNLAIQFNSKLERAIDRERSSDGEEARTVEEIRGGVFKHTFLATGGSQGQDLAMAGLGAQLGPAFIDGMDYMSGKHTEYVDVGEVYGRSAGNIRRNALESSEAVTDWSSGQAQTRILTVAGEGTLNAKSTRQSIDEYLDDFKKIRIEFHDRKRPFMTPDEIKEAQQQARIETGTVSFVDEPETGLSPRRHLAIAEELEDIFGSAAEGNIVITPTNSVVLFQSDLSRIDLDYPERGIHRPSDYPDHDAITT